MLTMAVATSIDALAAGISLAMDDANIWISVLLIGAITFTLSAIGVKVGNAFGSRYRKPAELIGGITLILMGFKIVLEHLGIIAL
jgi:putative Mn2+ efflux pump MntP